MTTVPAFLTVFAILAAPFAGSFVATLVVRLPAGEPVVLARSACRGCGHGLGWRDLVPFASWLASRGRCRHCGEKVGAAYPLVEAAAVAMALWAASVHGGMDLLFVCILGWGLLALTLIDLRTYLLPDALTLPLLALGLAAAALDGRLIAGAIGAAAGFSAFALIGVVYRILRGRDGLGLGDAKLLAVAGAWAGWAGLPGVVLAASLGALAVALVLALRGKPLDAGARIAFGPYLAAAIWLTVLYGPLVGG